AAKERLDPQIREPRDDPREVGQPVNPIPYLNRIHGPAEVERVREREESEDDNRRPEGAPCIASPEAKVVPGKNEVPTYPRGVARESRSGLFHSAMVRSQVGFPFHAAASIRTGFRPSPTTQAARVSDGTSGVQRGSTDRRLGTSAPV